MQLEIEIKTPPTALFQGRGAEIVREEQLGHVQAAVLVVQGEVAPRTPVNVGILRGGVQTDVVGDGVDVLGRVFNPVGYAPPVEAGSRPHFPPVAPLRLWVQRKGLASDPQEIRSIAFLIARKISRRGTPARFMFKDGLAAARPRVMALFERASRRIAQRLGQGA